MTGVGYKDDNLGHTNDLFTYYKIIQVLSVFSSMVVKVELQY